MSNNTVAVVKYNAGNIYSVIEALRRLGVEPTLTDDPAVLCKAHKVIFPGQGEASTAMSYLRARHLDEVIAHLTQPVLGICIGQQLLCRRSQEGNAQCLGLFPVDVERFVAPSPEFKIPHMGWNQLDNPQGPLFAGIEPGSYVYFVHSYYVPLCPSTIASTHYIHPFSAAIQRDNFFATQFHPEKSGPVGQRILQNFLNI